MAFSVIFLGTDDFSLKCLKCLVQHSALIKKDPTAKHPQAGINAKPIFEVRGVITQPFKPRGRGLSCLPSPVAKKAQALALPLLTPLNLKDPLFLSQVKNLKAKWAILLSYGRILPPAFLELFPQRALNFHASLLPRWRGSAPVQRAIMAGDKKTGLSLQVMTKGLDKGPVIGRRSFVLNRDMDAHVVFHKMESLMEELLMQDMLEYMQGQREAKPQKESLATNAPKIEKQENHIIWNKPAVVIFNQIRALVKGPQAYTFYKGKRIKIYQASLSSQNDIGPSRFKGKQKDSLKASEESCLELPDSKLCGNDKLYQEAGPGQVVEIHKESFKVACGEGSFIVILKLQPESKKVMSAGEYLRGYNLRVGDVFQGSTI